MSLLPRLRFLLLCASIVICATSPSVAFSLDHVKIPARNKVNVQRISYALSVVEAVMIATKSDYGDYKISTEYPTAYRERTIEELQTGKLINLDITTLKQTYLGKAIVIPFPIKRGILNYRLALVHKNDKDIFVDLKDSEQLKSYTVGLYEDMSTLITMRQLGYPTRSTISYEAMYSMLEYSRFDYTFRGINEAYFELELFSKNAPNVMVEPHTIFSLFLPTLMFVSPKEPRLAERIKKGLHRIHDSGEFKAIFKRYYSSQISRANISKRKVIKIKSPLEDLIDFPDIPGIWFDPNLE